MLLDTNFNTFCIAWKNPGVSNVKRTVTFPISFNSVYFCVTQADSNLYTGMNACWSSYTSLTNSSCVLYGDNTGKTWPRTMMIVGKI